MCEHLIDNENSFSTDNNWFPKKCQLSLALFYQVQWRRNPIYTISQDIATIISMKEHTANIGLLVLYAIIIFNEGVSVNELFVTGSEFLIKMT